MRPAIALLSLLTPLPVLPTKDDEPAVLDLILSTLVSRLPNQQEDETSEAQAKLIPITCELERMPPGSGCSIAPAGGSPIPSTPATSGCNKQMPRSTSAMTMGHAEEVTANGTTGDGDDHHPNQAQADDEASASRSSSFAANSNCPAQLVEEPPAPTQLVPVIF